MEAIEWRAVPDVDIEIAMTDKGEGPIFEQFFAGYDQAFILPSEKEDAEGFQDCLALNHGSERIRLGQEYGPFNEICLIARDGSTKAFVGGANFIALELPTQNGSVVSANLNYIFIDSAARGQGYFGRLVGATVAAVRWSLGSTADPLVFIEQNDPVSMAPEAYDQDTAFTGLDQLDRMRIWARQGAKVIDHPYVQPPLTPDATPDENLIYGVLGTAQDLSACTLRDHLRGFFGISVLKGAPIASSPIAERQLAVLDDLCAASTRIALLDPAVFLNRARNRSDLDGLLPVRPDSTRSAIRALG